MTKMRIFLLLVLALLFFTVVVIIKMPAAFVLNHLNQKTQLVYASGISGSIWHGSAHSMTIRANQHVIDLGLTQWHVSPWGTVFINAKNGSQHIKGLFDIDFDKSIAGSDVIINIPAPLITAFYPVPGKVEGMLELSLERVAFADNKVTELQGQLVAKDINVHVQVPAELGTFAASLQLEGSTLIANVQDIDAVVSATGKLSFEQEARAYAANLNITPKPDAPAVIARTLKYVAKKQADGSFAVKYNGSL